MGKKSGTFTLLPGGQPWGGYSLLLLAKRRHICQLLKLYKKNSSKNSSKKNSSNKIIKKFVRKFVKKVGRLFAAVVGKKTPYLPIAKSLQKKIGNLIIGIHSGWLYTITYKSRLTQKKLHKKNDAIFSIYGKNGIIP